MLGAAGRPEDVENLRHELGLDQPIYVQYVAGSSGPPTATWAIHRAAPAGAGEVVARFKNTLLLSTAAMLVSFPLGIAIGVLSAVKRGSLVDRVTIFLATFGLSLPSFWFGMVLIMIFTVELRLLPGTGMTSPIGGGGIGDIAKHMVLPTLALSVIPLAVIARYTRSSMLEVVSQDFVTTARAKGVTERRVVLHHVFRNTLVLIVTMLGLQVGFLSRAQSTWRTCFPGREWANCWLRRYSSAIFRSSREVSSWWHSRTSGSIW